MPIWANNLNKFYIYVLIFLMPYYLGNSINNPQVEEAVSQLGIVYLFSKVSSVIYTAWQFWLDRAQW